MIAVTNTTRIFVALEPVDFRKSFSGLQGLVQDYLQQDPLSGHLFVFTNRLRNRLKILCWDGSGLLLLAKRLEGGRFDWPSGEGKSKPLPAEDFHALLHGLEIVRREKWYRR